MVIIGNKLLYNYERVLDIVGLLFINIIIRIESVIRVNYFIRIFFKEFFKYMFFGILLNDIF